MGFVGRIDAIAAGEVDGPSPLDYLTMGLLSMLAAFVLVRRRSVG